MLTVATYLWGDKYGPDDVRRLKRMVSKYLTVPHEFAVITDKPRAFDGDKDIRAIPLDMSTHVPGTCFCRLFTFHKDGASIFGERMLVLDLDTIIVGNIDWLARNDRNIVMWRNPSRVPWHAPAVRGRPYYNTSLVMHRCGTMPWLRDKFDPRNPGSRDDQWWLSDLLGADLSRWDGTFWDGRHGVYRLGRDDTPGSGVVGKLPANACIVTFPGSEGKWSDPRIRSANPWIEQYCPEAACA